MNMLYVVATPIGNLEDISLRAVRVLKEVDLILAEDTRTSKVLLDRYEIGTRMISFHSYTDERKISELLGMIEKGLSLALISDAGTPGISDPGYKLTSRVREMGVKVVPVPGASAFLAGLSASGLPINQFVYLGFLPLKKGRKKLLEELKEEKRTIVFYESPHRILKTLKELAAVMPEREMVIGRELTKIYEEFLEGKAGELLERMGVGKVKGELVVMIAAERK